MFIYYRGMRTKDEEKKAALFEATVKVVNDIGFASSSVSKIAKEANVSPATLYVYYKSKEELLSSTYIDIKRHLSLAILDNFDEQLPVRDIFKKVWFNVFDYISNFPEHFKFTEQFANSPYVDLVDHAAVEHYFDPLLKVVQRGIEQKIIKDVHIDIISVFLFYPIMALVNSRLCQSFEPDRESIETVFTLAWDAIKL